MPAGAEGLVVVVAVVVELAREPKFAGQLMAKTEAEAEETEKVEEAEKAEAETEVEHLMKALGCWEDQRGLKKCLSCYH